MPGSQSLILVIAAMVAGIVLFRLYIVLGRRTGHEPEARPTPSPLAQPVPEALPAPAPAQGGLMDIQLADRNFDPAHFLSGARQAYSMIVDAFARGDRDTLRPLLSPDVMAAFESGIAGRGDEPAATLTRLADASIVHGELNGRQAEVTVSFNAEFATGPVTDVWTFARNVDTSDPNWLLVATSGGDAP